MAMKFLFLVGLSLAVLTAVVAEEQDISIVKTIYGPVQGSVNAAAGSRSFKVPPIN